MMELLEDTVLAAAGRPLILVNPILGDRPSSNNVMQIRGRSERRIFSDSFVDIFNFRLLYPSSGISQSLFVLYYNHFVIVNRWLYVSNSWVNC